MCFPPDTFVIGKYNNRLDIAYIGVGSWVLSRDEKTGEQAYRRVTKKFEHVIPTGKPDLPMYSIDYVTDSGEKSGEDVTLGHLFWVNGMGWVPASELKPGHKLEICDPLGNEDDVNRPEGSKSTDYALSGQRWQATVISAMRSKYDCGIVYNIEVEDFHTYFVGKHGVWVHNNKSK